MFDAIAVKALVDDFSQWRGDTYRLAILVAQLAAETEKDHIITLLEASNMQEAADVLKG